MATKMAERKKAIDKVQKMLWRRMDKLEYRDVTSFLKASGLEDKISFETVRRALNDKNKPPSPISVGVIMQRLGYSNDEIRKTMIELGDEYMHLLIEPGERRQALWQEGLYGAIDKIGGVDLDFIRIIAEYVQLMSRVANVDVGEDLKKMILQPQEESKA